MRKALGLMCLLILCAPAAVRGPSREFRKRVVNRGAAARVAAGATFGQIRNSPKQWGRGPAGFGKRLASGFGHHVVKTGIQSGVGALHHENLHYQRSNRHGTLPRLKYAVSRTFWVPRKNRRGHTVALGRISGNMGAGVVSSLWQPAAGVGAGVATGGIGLGAETGANVAREFWPRKHHRRVSRK